MPFFLLKFHCELNPIEYFWGMVKKYLCDNCDYSFDGLKENLPKALDLVPIQTIQHWEHQLFHWMGAYWAGLGLVTGEEIQLQEVQITQVYSRECSYTFGLMHIWCGACHLMVANLAQMKNISPSIFVQIIITLRDLFLA